jgi:hypothetical protein
MADFGKLLGVPCTISVNRYFDNPYNLFTFSGVSVGACFGGERSTLNVRTASDMDDPVSRGLNACATCSLNFETVTNSLTAVSNFVPYAGTGMFLFQGMVRLFKNLQDPHNIPRTYKSNPNHVLNTYRKYGKIPKKCVRRLRKGKQCLGSLKENFVAKVVNEKVKGSIKGIYKFKPLAAKVAVNGCDEKLKVYLKTGGNSVVDVPSHCQHLLKGKDVDLNFETPSRPTSYEVVERERIARERRERESRERARVERERVERDRLERERRERERLETAAMARYNTPVVGNLYDRNCYIQTRRGKGTLSIYNWSVKGIKEVGKRNANWFVQNPKGQDLALYRSRRGGSKIMFKNVKLKLGRKFRDSIDIYSKDNRLKEISIKDCWGYDRYKSKLKR